MSLPHLKENAIYRDAQSLCCFQLHTVHHTYLRNWLGIPKAVCVLTSLLYIFWRPLNKRKQVQGFLNLLLLLLRKRVQLGTNSTDKRKVNILTHLIKQVHTVNYQLPFQKDPVAPLQPMFGPCVSLSSSSCLQLPCLPLSSFHCIKAVQFKIKQK